MKLEKITNKHIIELNKVAQRYIDYYEIYSLLNWDSEVVMPENAQTRRGELLSLLELENNKVIRSNDFKVALQKCIKEQDNLNTTEQGILRIAKKKFDTIDKLPEKFVKKMVEQFNKSSHSWRKAKAENDFSMYQENLEKNLEINHEYISYLKDKEEHPYDILLNEYESGLTTNLIKNLFADLVPSTRNILSKIKEKPIKTELIDGTKYTYDIESQIKISKYIKNSLGLKDEFSRIDTTSHPFSEYFNHNDVRITTRYNVIEPFSSILSTMHEVGHALYMCGYDESIKNTFVGNTDLVLGLHESQSRSWENYVGRTIEFCEYLHGLMSPFFPWLKKYTPEDIYNILTQVKPSLIRVESDELTYNLHIALRLEIEISLIEGTIQVKDLPEYWVTKMQEYLGIKPETLKEGILQDPHWSHGLLGYFPTYTLGNIYGTQLFNTFLQDTNSKSFFNEVKNGQFSKYLSWLRDKIHRSGMIYEPTELIEQVTGDKINIQYLVQYLEKKYT